MKLRFYKYQGAGNDFILFDNRSNVLSVDDAHWFNRICNRRFGIGADGVMLLENHPSLDFKMVYFNADGNESSMCGNGGRCMVNFARKLGIQKSIYRFEAIDGIHEAVINQNIVELQMMNVNDISKMEDHYLLDTGSPHYVTLVNDIQKMDVVARGRTIRYKELYQPGGVNVNFIEIIKEKNLIRTYERGVEDETLSCGTGVTAAALIISLENEQPAGTHTITLETMGGDLQVRFHKTDDGRFNNIWLIGPGELVYEGEILKN